jgi:hypothetical protein
MNIKDTINNVFAKMPFKGFAEKIPDEKRAKVPMLDKLIPLANQIVCGIAVVLVIIIIAAASGGGPKSLAKQTYKLTQQSYSAGSNPSKVAALFKKLEKIQAKVGKLSNEKQLIYLAEVGRLMGNSVGDLPDIAGIDLSDLSSAPASGTANKQADFTFQLTADGKGVIITGLSGNPKTVNIPSKFEGVPVVEIGYNAFQLRPGLSSITIPNTVTKISSGAFRGTGITKIVIPDSVTEFEWQLFSGCKMLTELKLSDNISKLYYLGDTFKKVNFPKNLKEIAYNAFLGCEELTDLVIPDTITKLTFFRFDDNNNDVPLSEVEIPSTFKGCQKLSIKTRQRLKQLGYNGEF